MSTPPDSTLDIAGGDVGLSRHLKDSLRLLAKRSDEPAFSRLIDDVLSGKRSLREAYTDPPYTRVMDAQVRLCRPLGRDVGGGEGGAGPRQ